MNGKKLNSMNEFPLMDESKGIPLFYPYIPINALDSVSQTLSSRWIGQGPKVDIFEREFKKTFLNSDISCIAVGSGTDALHLAYLLADISKNDEVLVPVFTCTATNLPLLYIGANPIFVDCNPKTMNIDENDIEHRITNKTKAIVCVDYGGVPCNYSELKRIAKKYNLKLICDAAHSLGSKYNNEFIGNQADFTIYSFQAIKTITAGDGGLLAFSDAALLNKAKRLRWFGIDREAKQGGIWENDIVDIGFKYQMNDISAAIAIEGLKEFEYIRNKRRELFGIYVNELSNNKNIEIVGSNDSKDICPWLLTILVQNSRIELMNKLRAHNVESAQVHYRNDRYTVFGGRRKDLPNMDLIENNYLVLPLHMKMSNNDVLLICNVINNFYSNK